MRWPAALNSKPRRVLAIFAVAELSLALAVPFLATSGFQSLLNSRAGVLVEEKESHEPGWRAFVEPSTVTAVVERQKGETTGVTLVINKPEVPGGNIVVVPGSLQIDGFRLSDRSPPDAIAALSRSLRLYIADFFVIEDNWEEVLADKTYEIFNPDSVSETQEQLEIDESQEHIDSTNAANFVGVARNGTPVSALLRRQLFWEALAEDPPVTGHPIAIKLAELDTGDVEITAFPDADGPSNPEFDSDEAEKMVRSAVPIPAGSDENDRIKLQVIDRTGSANLISVTSQLGARGIEVVEIGNAVAFESGPTELIVPNPWTGPDLDELAEDTGATVRVDDVTDNHEVATLIIGDDFTVESA